MKTPLLRQSLLKMDLNSLRSSLCWMCLAIWSERSRLCQWVEKWSEVRGWSEVRSFEQATSFVLELQSMTPFKWLFRVAHPVLVENYVAKDCFTVLCQSESNSSDRDAHLLFQQCLFSQDANNEANSITIGTRCRMHAQNNVVHFSDDFSNRFVIDSQSWTSYLYMNAYANSTLSYDDSMKPGNWMFYFDEPTSMCQKKMQCPHANDYGYQYVWPESIQMASHDQNCVNCKSICTNCVGHLHRVLFWPPAAAMALHL